MGGNLQHGGDATAVANSGPERVCRIIHTSELHCHLQKRGLWSSSPDYTIIGLFTKPYEVRFREIVDVFGIRFKPEGIYNLFGIPASEFHATYEDMELVLGDRFRDFCAKLREKSTIQNRIRQAETYLICQLDKTRLPLSYVNEAAEIIRASGGYLKIEDLCSQVYISLRQLQREFKLKVGISPKNICGFRGSMRSTSYLTAIRRSTLPV